jgi:hypothetical protein
MFEVAGPFKCELRVAQIIAEQARNGVNFNRTRASFSIHILSERILHLDYKAVPQMPRMQVKGNEFKKPFLKSGKYSKYVQDYVDIHGAMEIGGPFTRVYYTQFDMSKTAKVKEWLLHNGWKPEEFNLKESNEEHVQDYLEALRAAPDRVFKEAILGIPRLRKRHGGVLKRSVVVSHLLSQRKWPTSPKIPKEDDQFNHEMRDVNSDVGRLVQRRLVWAHRRSLLKGLISKLRPDGKLSAQANPCATPTFRFKHKVVVNIPAPRSPYGKEIRKLFIGSYSSSDTLNKFCSIDGSFIPRNQRAFVGFDASGLELRMLAHYINDPTYTEVICNGDAHTMHQNMAGLPTRDDAKTFIYAFLYGAGDAKLGSIVGGTAKDGKRLRDQFLKSNPLLAEAISRVQEEASTGSLKGLDGRRIIMRRNYQGDVMIHKALNTLLQAAGAIVMKYSMIWLDTRVKREGLDAWKVIDQHDEGQYDCHPKCVDRLREIMEASLPAAGRFLNMNVPLAAESKAGASWFDTH